MSENLLRIDVKAEIRKLTRQRFKTAGDYAVELVRWAASRLPLRLDIDVSRSRLEIRHDGKAIPGTTLKRLVTLFDHTRPPGERHAAIVAIEEEEGLGLLAAFSLKAPRVTIEATVEGRRRRVEFAPSGLASSTDPRAREGFVIEVRGSGRRPSLERRMLAEACRYSIIPISLDGARINRGPRVDDSLVYVDLRNQRLHGTIGLPATSDLTRIIRLRHGIRLEEKIRPGANGMIFHAVIDEQDDDIEASWGTLRRAARRLYQRLGKRYAELDDDHRARALKLLFERYEHTKDGALLKGVNAFRLIGGPRLDLDTVRAWSRAWPLFALDPSRPAAGYDLEGRRVFALDAMQRGFLERELERPLLPPPPRLGRIGAMRRLRMGARDLAKRVGEAFGGGPGRPVPDEDLSAAQRRFLEELSAEIRSGGFSLAGEARPFGLKIRMASGQRRPWLKVDRRDGRSEYRVSVDHPLVRAMIDAVEADPSLLYPALVALTNGHDGYADSRSVHQRAILTRYGVD